MSAEWRGRRIGPYEIVERLGHGGMGVVYKAMDTVLDRPVAIKMMMASGDEGVQREQTARFLVEAKAAARIQSRHVAQVLQFGETPEGEVYIAMELLNGQPLSRLIQKEGRVGVVRAVRIARHICRGMHAAHALGVIHRDLKPANVMIVSADGEDEVAKILDFGVAKLTTDQGASSAGLTQQGALLGTLPFMAPEQIEGKRVDARTDIYALGVIIYRMITGTPMFDVESLSDLVRNQIATTPESPRVRAPDALIAAEVDAVVMKCLEKSPDKRWESMQALEAALATAAGASQDVSAPRVRAPVTKEETLPTGTHADTAMAEMVTLISVDMEMSSKVSKATTTGPHSNPVTGSAIMSSRAPTMAPAAELSQISGPNLDIAQAIGAPIDKRASRALALAAGAFLVALFVCAGVLFMFRDRLFGDGPIEKPMRVSTPVVVPPPVGTPAPPVTPPPPAVVATPIPEPVAEPAPPAPIKSATKIAKPKVKAKTKASGSTASDTKPEEDAPAGGFVRVHTSDGETK